MRVKKTVFRLLHSDSGATAIEYAMIASGIAVAISATIYILGDTLNTEFFKSIVKAFD